MSVVLSHQKPMPCLSSHSSQPKGGDGATGKSPFFYLIIITAVLFVKTAHRLILDFLPEIV
jgi:hypothetical protein